MRKKPSKNLGVRQKLVIYSCEAGAEEFEAESFPIHIVTVRKIKETLDKNLIRLSSDSEDSGSDGEFSSTEDSHCSMDSTQKRKKIRKSRKHRRVILPSVDLVFSMDCI